MENYFRTLWSSAQGLDKWFAAFSILALFCGLMSPAFGIIAYKLSQRRDILTSQLAAAAELTRKQDSIHLNQKVAETAAMAETSVRKLESAEEDLSRSQTQLADATKRAAVASLGFAEAQAKIRELDKKGKKVISLQLRSIITLTTEDKPLGDAGNVMSVENNMAFWVGPTVQPIQFHTDRSEQRQTGDRQIQIISDLQPDDPLAVSGLDLTALDNRNVLLSNEIQGIALQSKNGRTATHWRWIVIINGAAFPLIDSDLPPDALGRYGAQKVIPLNIPTENQLPSQKYQALFE